MLPMWKLIWSICLTLAFLPNPHQGLSVSFPYQGPLHVAKGRELVVQAQLLKSPTEKIFRVTWDDENETGQRQVRLATYQDTLDSQKLQWRVKEMNSSDYGVYIITVTDVDGNLESAQLHVKESDAGPVSSISLLCEVGNERAHWDDTTYSWLVDGVEVSNQTANLSADGRRLHLSGMRGHKYTCIASNSLGISSVHYIIDSTVCPNICCIVCGVMVAIILTVFGVILWKHLGGKATGSQPI